MWGPGILSLGVRLSPALQDFIATPDLYPLGVSSIPPVTTTTAETSLVKEAQSPWLKTTGGKETRLGAISQENVKAAWTVGKVGRKWVQEKHRSSLALSSVRSDPEQGLLE